MFLTPSANADFLIVGILALIIGHSFYIYSQGRWFLFDPINAFWGGVLIVYVEQPTSHAVTFIGWNGESAFVATLGWILFGLVWVVVGYELPLGDKLGRKIPAMPGTLKPGRIVLAAWILIVLGLLAYAHDFSTAGGAANWLSVGRGGTNYEQASLYIIQLESLLPVGVGLLVFWVEWDRTAKFLRLIAWGLGILMWWWFLYLGTRSRVIGFALLLLGAWYLPRRKNPSTLFLIPLFFALLLISNFQANYRWQFTDLSFHLEEIDWEEAKERCLPGWLLGRSRDNKVDPSRGIEFNCVTSVVKLVPEDVPYNYGLGHLEVLTRPIPRSIWPTKRWPHLESVQGVLREAELSDSMGGASELLAGPSFTFAGHWYYAGGPVGLFLGGLLTGVIFRAIRAIRERDTKNIGDLLLYSQLLLIGFNEAAATPLYWLTILPFTVIPLLALLYFCREHSHVVPGRIRRPPAHFSSSANS